MNEEDKWIYLGRWSKTLNITIADIDNNAQISNRMVTNGFIFELRFLYRGIQSDIQCAQKLKRMEPTLETVKILSVAKRVREVCEKIKKYLKNSDSHIDVYLAESFDVLRRLHMTLSNKGNADIAPEGSKVLGDGRKRKDDDVTILSCSVTNERESSESGSSRGRAERSKDTNKSLLAKRKSPFEVENSHHNFQAKRLQQKPLHHSYSDFMSFKRRTKTKGNYKEYIEKQRRKRLRESDTKSRSTSPEEVIPTNVGVAEKTDSRQNDEEGGNEVEQRESETPTESIAMDVESERISHIPTLSMASINCEQTESSWPDPEEGSPEQEGDESVQEIDDSKLDEENEVATASNDKGSSQEPSWKSELANLARHPPDLFISLSSLHEELVCGICNGFIYNATTIAECMHTFCRKCILFHIEFHNRCPTCNALIDQSNPYGNLRPDTIYQDIINKLLPDFAEDEHRKKEEFYRELGYTTDELPPDAGHVKYNNSDSRLKKRHKQVKRWVSVHLQFIGYDTKQVPPVKELECSYLRVPESTQVRHLQAMLAKLLPLSDYFQALLFYSRFILHSDLKMSGVEALFCTEETQTTDDEDEKLLVLQYGVVPKGHDYYTLLETDHDLEKELDATMPVIDESGGPLLTQQTSDEFNNTTSLDDEVSQLTSLSETMDESSNDSMMSTNSQNIAASTGVRSPTVSRSDSVDKSFTKSPSPAKTEARSKAAGKSPGSMNPHKRGRPKMYKTKQKYVWVCCLCQTEQCNIYCHLSMTHKLNGEDRRLMAHKCKRFRINTETGDCTPASEVQTSETQKPKVACDKGELHLEGEDSQGSISSLFETFDADLRKSRDMSGKEKTPGDKEIEQNMPKKDCLISVNIEDTCYSMKAACTPMKSNSKAKTTELSPGSMNTVERLSETGKQTEAKFICLSDYTVESAIQSEESVSESLESLMQDSQNSQSENVTSNTDNRHLESDKTVRDSFNISSELNQKGSVKVVRETSDQTESCSPLLGGNGVLQEAPSTLNERDILRDQISSILLPEGVEFSQDSSNFPIDTDKLIQELSSLQDDMPQSEDKIAQDSSTLQQDTDELIKELSSLQQPSGNMQLPEKEDLPQDSTNIQENTVILIPELSSFHILSNMQELSSLQETSSNMQLPEKERLPQQVPSFMQEDSDNSLQDLSSLLEYSAKLLPVSSLSQVDSARSFLESSNLQENTVKRMQELSSLQADSSKLLPDSSILQFDSGTFLQQSSFLQEDSSKRLKNQLSLQEDSARMLLPSGENLLSPSPLLPPDLPFDSHQALNIDSRQLLSGGSPEQGGRAVGVNTVGTSIEERCQALLAMSEDDSHIRLTRDSRDELLRSSEGELEHYSMK